MKFTDLLQTQTLTKCWSIQTVLVLYCLRFLRFTDIIVTTNSLHCTIIRRKQLFYLEEKKIYQKKKKQTKQNKLKQKATTTKKTTKKQKKTTKNKIKKTTLKKTLSIKLFLSLSCNNKRRFYRGNALNNQDRAYASFPDVTIIKWRDTAMQDTTSVPKVSHKIELDKKKRNGLQNRNK